MKRMTQSCTLLQGEPTYWHGSSAPGKAYEPKSDMIKASNFEGLLVALLAGKDKTRLSNLFWSMEGRPS